jgi:hypothetical protein
MDYRLLKELEEKKMRKKLLAGELDKDKKTLRGLADKLQGVLAVSHYTVLMPSLHVCV